MSTLPGLLAVFGLNWRRPLRLIASAERGSEHRPGEATVRRAGELGLSLSQTSSLQAESERGIVAVVEGRSPLIGNARTMDAHGTQPNSLGEQAFALAVQGKTPMYVVPDNEAAGPIAVADDTLKPESAEAVRKLKALGLEVWMLTGHNRATARAIASQAGITNILAEVLLQQELAKVVAMVGNDINNAPALAQADLGISIGAGADVAIEASDITLVWDVHGVVTAVALSRRTIIPLLI